MNISLIAAGFLIGVPLSIQAQELSAEMKAYTQSIFAEDGKLMSEFNVFSRKFPVQSAYFIALFTGSSCGNPTPSAKLKVVSAPDAFLNTEEGQKVFVVMGAISTMKYPSSEKKAQFCSSAKLLVDFAEKHAASQP